MGRRGHAEPRETEAGDEFVWKERDWRYNCCQGIILSKKCPATHLSPSQGRCSQHSNRPSPSSGKKQKAALTCSIQCHLLPVV